MSRYPGNRKLLRSFRSQEKAKEAMADYFNLKTAEIVLSRLLAARLKVVPRVYSIKFISNASQKIQISGDIHHTRSPDW